MFILLTITFGLIKFQHLVEHKNPSLITNFEELEVGEKIDTDSDDFVIAFSVTNDITGEAITVNSPLFQIIGATQQNSLENGFLL